MNPLRVFTTVSTMLALACSSATAGPFSGPFDVADAGDEDAPASIADASMPTDVTVADAARKKDAAPRQDSGATTSITKCEQDASCTGTDRCTEDDGATYHYCTCSADHLGCGEIQASPPNTCLEGGVCAKEGNICATDDGTTVNYCRCTSSAWACSSLTTPTANCSVSSNTCFFAPSGKTEWLGCFSRNLGSVQGVVCHTTNGGWGANGMLFTPTCPEDPPRVGSACAVSGNLFCGCADPVTNERCVCSCPAGAWECMP